MYTYLRTKVVIDDKHKSIICTAKANIILIKVCQGIEHACRSLFHRAGSLSVILTLVSK